MNAKSLIVILLLSITVSYSKAQLQPGPELTYTDFRWMKEKWTGDDRPYVEAAKQIEKSIDKNIGMFDEYMRLREYATRHSKEALPQFKWAYCLTHAKSRLAADFGRQQTSYREELTRVWTYLAGVTSPKTKSFARMRFIVEVSIVPRQEYLPIAQRLYEDDKSDGFIAHKYAFLLADGKSISNCRMGIKIAKELIERKGATASNLELAATCHAFAWFLAKDKRDAKEGIVYFERAIKASKNESNKKLMQRKIDQLRREAKLVAQR